MAQYFADRPGDVVRREGRRGHLIEQRLEGVVVVAIDEDDIGVGAAESLLRTGAGFDLQDLAGAYVYVKP